ncbi:hypothetical protein NH340_JMT08202 [Sarcoptes scabiei]|nr:hypothetical protein NH340_JMT08202 [Sarcoptes scabiei]
MQILRSYLKDSSMTEKSLIELNERSNRIDLYNPAPNYQALNRHSPTSSRNPSEIGKDLSINLAGFDVSNDNKYKLEQDNIETKSITANNSRSLNRYEVEKDLEEFDDLIGRRLRRKKSRQKRSTSKDQIRSRSFRLNFQKNLRKRIPREKNQREERWLQASSMRRREQRLRDDFSNLRLFGDRQPNHRHQQQKHRRFRRRNETPLLNDADENILDDVDYENDEVDFNHKFFISNDLDNLALYLRPNSKRKNSDNNNNKGSIRMKSLKKILYNKKNDYRLETQKIPSMMVTSSSSSSNNAKNNNSNNGSRNRNLYSKESKNIEKYDLLGSGNFEIIRGGILEKTPLKDSPNSQQSNQRSLIHNDDASDGGRNFQSNVATDNNNFDSNENDSNEDDDDDDSNESGDDGDDRQQNGRDQENDDQDNFEPFNLDLFENNPILRDLQGYDNFAASKPNALIRKNKKL